MKPLNSKQRINTFFIFLLLFTFTTSIIVLAIFFGFRVPSIENAMHRERNRQIINKEGQGRNFADHMEEVKALLDSMDMPGVNSDYMERLVSSELADMQSSLPVEDSTYRRKMYSNIIQTFLELKNAKSSLIQLNDVRVELDEYDELIDQYKRDLNQAQRDLDICRQMSRR